MVTGAVDGKRRRALYVFRVQISVFSRLPASPLSHPISHFALFVPTRLRRAQKGWLGEGLLRLDPITAGEHYVGRIVVDGRAWSEDVSWLLSPTIAAVVLTAAALAAGSRLRLAGGVGR